jgi:hypothetical protein
LAAPTVGGVDTVRSLFVLFLHEADGRNMEPQETLEASNVDELTKDNFEILFGDTPLTIADSEVKD